MILLLLGCLVAFAQSPSAPSEGRPVAVFVHGMFMTPDSWSAWRAHFEARGYDTVAPAWPGRDRPPAECRNAPDPVLGDLTLSDVVGLYRDAIQELGDRPVVLVGHSMGGLVVQLLLQEDAALAGVAIDSAPPKGISSLRWSFLRANAPVLWPSNAPISPSVRQFRYAFAHTLPMEEVEAIYEAFVVPESRRVGRGPTGPEATIDFARPRPPLLLVAGEDDHIIPASLVRKNHAAYAESPAVTDLRAFAGRVHWIVGQEGWEEVADDVLAWLETHRRRARTP